MNHHRNLVERFRRCWNRRMLKMAVSKAAASEEARRTLRYVEPLSDARTPLADFFSILLDDTRFRDAWRRVKTKACSSERSRPIVRQPVYRKLVALCVQHAIFRCITEDIGDTAAKSIHRTIDPIIEGMAEWV
jgi:hypothetical protein